MNSSNPLIFPCILDCVCSYNHILTKDCCCKNLNIRLIGGRLDCLPCFDDILIGCSVDYEYDYLSMCNKMFDFFFLLLRFIFLSLLVSKNVLRVFLKTLMKKKKYQNKTLLAFQHVLL